MVSLAACIGAYGCAHVPFIFTVQEVQQLQQELAACRASLAQQSQAAAQAAAETEVLRAALRDAEMDMQVRYTRMSVAYAYAMCVSALACSSRAWQWCTVSHAYTFLCAQGMVAAL